MATIFKGRVRNKSVLSKCIPGKQKLFRNFSLYTNPADDLRNLKSALELHISNPISASPKRKSITNKKRITKEKTTPKEADFSFLLKSSTFNTTTDTVKTSMFPSRANRLAQRIFKRKNTRRQSLQHFDSEVDSPNRLSIQSKNNCRSSDPLSKTFGPTPTELNIFKIKIP